VILIYKSLIYRIIATLSVVIVAFIATGNFKTSLIVGGADVVIKTALYYLYELVWARIVK
jgi:uncharacterized membrane protein